MKVEVGLVHRLKSRDQHRKILGPAAGHDGVDRGGMDRQLKSGRRVGRDHRLRRPPLVSKRGVHALQRWGDHRQTIGPAFLIAVVDCREQIVGNFVDAGIKWHARLAGAFWWMWQLHGSANLAPDESESHLIHRQRTPAFADASSKASDGHRSSARSVVWGQVLWPSLWPSL